nr:hypothetical protein Iba_scaffold19429CG0100 [Ipomoea batatas]
MCLTKAMFLIHYISMLFLSLRMCGSFNFHLSAIFHRQCSLLNSNRRLQIILSRCLILHRLVVRKRCCLSSRLILYYSGFITILS